MNTTQSFFLGLVQGITEFLPISSSAHLVIFQKVFGLTYHDITFDIIVHLATLLSVCTVFYSVLLTIVKDIAILPWKKPHSNGVQAFKLVFFASIPTAVIGFTFKSVFEQYFSNLLAVGIFMCITGLILFLTRIKKESENFENKKKVYEQGLTGINDISIKKALLIGLVQGGAIAPGISRSGSTIAAAVMLNVNYETAAMYSFLLAIPAILGAFVSEVSHLTWSSGELTVLGVGFVSAYLSGILGLRTVVKIVKKGRLDLFSFYMWIVGIGCILKAVYS